MSSRKDKLTKRIALGVVFSVCDPLELESPVVAELKLTIQSFWKESQVWGNVLSDEKGRTFQDVSSGGENKSWVFQGSLLRNKVGTKLSFIVLQMRLSGFLR